MSSTNSSSNSSSNTSSNTSSDAGDDGAPGYGRSHAFLFNASQYLTLNADLSGRIDSSQALAHYLSVGASEGRDPNPWFDADHYRNRYDDLRNGGFDDATLFMHFNLYGVWEGRACNARLDQFDGDRYLADNPDVAAYVDANLASFLGSRDNGAIAHFLIYGAGEQRAAFDNSGQAFDVQLFV